MSRDWLSLQEAAEHLGVTPEALVEAAAKGLLRLGVLAHGSQGHAVPYQAGTLDDLLAGADSQVRRHAGDYGRDRAEGLWFLQPADQQHVLRGDVPVVVRLWAAKQGWHGLWPPVVFALDQHAPPCRVSLAQLWVPVWELDQYRLRLAADQGISAEKAGSPAGRGAAVHPAQRRVLIEYIAALLVVDWGWDGNRYQQQAAEVVAALEREGHAFALAAVASVLDLARLAVCRDRDAYQPGWTDDGRPLDRTLLLRLLGALLAHKREWRGDRRTRTAEDLMRDSDERGFALKRRALLRHLKAADQLLKDAM